uniref:Uncharacterized protein n=1 Tax=Cacopsylla melanoneura TaxID=428564 RepID=A0A8D8LZ52_9HEMI
MRSLARNLSIRRKTRSKSWKLCCRKWMPVLKSVRRITRRFRRSFLSLSRVVAAQQAPLMMVQDPPARLTVRPQPARAPVVNQSRISVILSRRSGSRRRISKNPRLKARKSS